jgi:hypothetical protein
MAEGIHRPAAPALLLATDRSMSPETDCERDLCLGEALIWKGTMRFDAPVEDTAGKLFSDVENPMGSVRRSHGEGQDLMSFHAATVSGSRPNAHGAQ